MDSIDILFNTKSPPTFSIDYVENNKNKRIVVSIPHKYKKTVNQFAIRNNVPRERMHKKSMEY
jgi:hypothetical protein